MTIYIDADACPVTRIAENIAKQHGIPVTLLCDTNHQLTSDYSTVKIIGAGADAVDIALINLCRRGDVVVTQDYGVAALALGKGAKAIPPCSGCSGGCSRPRGCSLSGSVQLPSSPFRLTI